MKVQSYKNQFIMQIQTKRGLRVETVNEDSKIKVQKSVFAAKYNITREITKAKKNHEIVVIRKIKID